MPLKLEEKYINEEVEQIYVCNIRLFDKIINDKTEEQIEKLNTYMTLNGKVKGDLTLFINKQVKEYIKRQIEQKLIIEKLYPDNMKEEALKKLPRFVQELGYGFSD